MAYVEVKSAYLYFNPNVQNILDNVSTQVRPLQAKGIKVMLSILGNHQGAGFANFPSQQAAATFAKQLSDTVTKYGLDGIDFDDEYSEYGKNGTWGVPNIALPKSGLSPAAVQIAATSAGTAAGLAQRTVSEGYGVYLTYNLAVADSHTYISSFTKPLYGKDAVYRP